MGRTYAEISSPEWVSAGGLTDWECLAGCPASSVISSCKTSHCNQFFGEDAQRRYGVGNDAAEYVVS